MDEKETRGVPRGLPSLPCARLSLDVVKDKLVHQTGHGESSEDGGEWGPLSADERTGESDDGIVYGRVQDTVDHDVPALPPEVLQRSAEVGLVELRFQVNAEEFPSGGGDGAENELQAYVHVEAVQEEKEFGVKILFYAVEGNEEGEYDDD